MSTYLRFDEEGEPEKIAKYFIYLTNNGRLVIILLAQLLYMSKRSGPRLYKTFSLVFNLFSSTNLEIVEILLEIFFLQDHYSKEQIIR